jgi:two-component system phosphate regulon response regulator PhoB
VNEEKPPAVAVGRVLIVDDDEWIRRPFKRVLEREGYEVHAAVDAEGALAQARTVIFDVVILDLHMPLIDGLGFLYRLRELAEYQDVPVALVTGDSELSDEIMAGVKALRAQVVFKPVGARALAELASTLLSGRSALP